MWRSCAGAPDMIVLSAHKFGGPKGAGALVVRSGTRFTPDCSRWRAGTGAAARHRERRRDRGHGDSTRLGHRTEDGRGRENLPHEGPARGLDLLRARRGRRDRRRRHARRQRRQVGQGGRKLPPDDPGVERDELLFLLDSEGVYASAGSACASGATQPSHVLQAIGVDLEVAGQIGSALRLSLGHTTTEAEIDHAVAVIPKVVEHLRA